jgi:hypothetical protein
MALWHNWPEDEPEEDDDFGEAEPDVPKSDDDNDGDDDENDGDESQHESQFHNLPPPGPDTDHNQDECFRNAFEEGGYTSDNPFDVGFYSYSSRIVLSPLPDHRKPGKAQQSTQYILPVLSKGRVNLKGGTGSVYEIEVLNTHLPRNLKASDSYNTGRVCILTSTPYPDC